MSTPHTPAMPQAPYPWQQDLVDRAHRLIQSARMPHAILLNGTIGWGDVPLGGVLAAMLLEIEVPELSASTLEAIAQDSEGKKSKARSKAAKARAAKAAEAAERGGTHALSPMRYLAHPDLSWIVPDGAAIKVEDIRDLTPFVYGTRRSAPRKVVVIQDAHALNNSAANALLKMLEEPPDGTHFLLITTSLRRLLPTVRSRCQRFDIAADNNAAIAWLRAEAGDNANVAALLADHGGAPLAAYAAVAARDRAFTEWLRDLPDTDERQRAAVLLEVGLAGVASRWWRALLRHLAGQEIIADISGAEPRRVLQFADELLFVKRWVETDNSPNQELLAERLLDGWRRLTR